MMSEFILLPNWQFLNLNMAGTSYDAVNSSLTQLGTFLNAHNPV
jgi:hypothetical protein